MDVRVGLWRRLSAEELMLLNCGVGEDLESLLDCKEIKSVNPKGIQPWIFIARTDAEAEAPIFWPPDVKNWLIGKDQQEKGMTEDELVGWCHRLDGHEFEQVPGVGDGQGGLACCSPWGCRVGRDWVTELNWIDWVLDLCPVEIWMHHDYFLTNA